MKLFILTIFLLQFIMASTIPVAIEVHDSDTLTEEIKQFKKQALGALNPISKAVCLSLYIHH